MTAAEYQEMIKNKAIVQKHYGPKSHKNLFIIEYEKKFTENDMIEFAMWFSDKNCTYHDLQKYVKLNTSVLHSQAKSK